MTMNISEGNALHLQNDGRQIKLLKARRQLYFDANWLLWTQVVLTVAVPMLGSLFAIAFSPARPWVACISLVILAIDLAVLDKPQKQLLRDAAKLQEKFDCVVLGMEWNEFTAGSEVVQEDINGASAAFDRRVGSDAKLRDWYPTALAKTGPAEARVLCQLTNVWYDGRVRRRYALVLLGTALILTTILVTIGLCLRLEFPALVLTVFAPASVIITWTVREFRRQMDVVETVNSLELKANALWRQISSGLSTNEAACRSRALQDAIFNHRARSPLTAPFLYNWMRRGMEMRMNSAAEDRIGELTFVAEEGV